MKIESTIILIFIISSLIGTRLEPINMNFNYYGKDLFSIIVNISRSISGCMVCCYICQWISNSNLKIKKIMIGIGRNTLVILAFHLYLFQLYNKTLQLAGITGMWSKLLSLLLLIASLYILDRVINKYLPFAAGKQWKKE